MTVIRCPWPKDDALYCAYHDEEWGVPVYDPKALWGKLVLDGFQAGLSWITILRKREAFLEAFAGFDPEVVARFTDADRARLLGNPGIIRSAAKIDAAIKGARLYLDLQDAGTNFSQLLWDHVDGRPIQNRYMASSEVPTQTAQSEALSKRLKAHGFSFVGPVIVYAFMEAVGMVNDHLVICHRHAEVAKLGRAL